MYILLLTIVLSNGVSTTYIVDYDLSKEDCLEAVQNSSGTYCVPVYKF